MSPASAPAPHAAPRRLPRPSRVLVAAALGALGVATLAGCGNADDEPRAPRSTTTTRTSPPRTVAAVSSEAYERGVVLEGRNHGLRLWLHPSAEGDERRLRATIQVMPTATVALRRRLARTAGTELACETDGVPSQGVVVTTTGPRDAVPVGHRITTSDFLTLPKGRTAPQAVRSCRVAVAAEARGSTTRSYSDDPRTTLATYRFR